MNMATIDYAWGRIASALEEIDRLMQSEFPYEYPKVAMGILKERFRNRELVLERIRPDTPVPVIQNECSMSLEMLFVYVPILGFILRSTNVRNAFEAYGPLLRLAMRLMGQDTKLIISSEWEFSPFVYRSITDLPGFVLIGLPATESSNPLVIPLAGHELGHSVWEMKRVEDEFKDRIRQGTLDELRNKRWSKYKELFPQYKKADLEEDWLGRLSWQPACQWSLLQAEEMFCDFFGLRIFAESYLHAFSYLNAPGTSGQRSLRYPNIKRRVNHLCDAANMMKFIIPTDFTTNFVPETEPVEPTTALLVSVADTVSASCANDLLENAQGFADNNDVPFRKFERVKHIVGEFKKWVVPTAKSETLVDILNAGWECKLDNHLWDIILQIKKDEWGRILRNLMLKSMEVSEIHARLRKSL